MPIGPPFQNVPKSGWRCSDAPIDATHAVDRSCTGYAEMSVFHGLSAGKIVQSDAGGADEGENVKTPPSRATNQYPESGDDAMPTIAWLSRMLPVLPKKVAVPNEKMPPSDATSQ